MKNIAILSSLLLFGCAKVVEPWHPVEEPRVVETTIHCTYVGYCLDVATFGLDGTFHLGPSIGFRYNCSGVKPARVREQLFEQTWDSGYVERRKKVEVLESWGECK